MNYNYTQPQLQQAAQLGYGGAYKPMPQYPQWPVTSNIPQQVRPVSSIDEVRACPIDFDGSVFYFTDVANKRIYTKQINLDGTVSINLYELKTDQVTNSTQYVTKQEFENVISQLYNKFNPLLNPVVVEEKKEQTIQAPAAQQQQTQQKPLFEF